MHTPAPNDFAQRVLAWFDVHGRHDLPWQHPIDPYRVWVSEIMLQQTQVKTVIPYFQQFMLRFPDVQALAAAELDAVLHLWTGLGYYARARNLHRAAREICSEHGGSFPNSVEALSQLPGIGRSTAGAIASIACGQRAPILDGNVKRVLARFHGVAGWPGQSAVAQQLWALAEQHTPTQRVAGYTQAMMDLGATVCSRSRPACKACPLQPDCVAHAQGRQAELPGRKPRRALPERSTVFVLATNGTGWLLEQRTASGLWGGLWCFPQVGQTSEVDHWCQLNLGSRPEQLELLSAFRHTFSHYHLQIQPVVARLKAESVAAVHAGAAGLREMAEEPALYADRAPRTNRASAVQNSAQHRAGIAGRMVGPQRLWYNPRAPADIGLAAPVVRLLRQLEAAAEHPAATHQQKEATP